MNEWGFASEISKWWEAEFADHPQWHLTYCRVEETVPGSQKRSDLFAGGSSKVICGELRLPDHARSSAWDITNIQDAINKAMHHGCRWAFTSDSKELLLVDTTLTGSLFERIIHRVELEPFENRQQLDSPSFLARVKECWVEALCELGPIITGIANAPGMSVDELFINALRALLASPVAAIRDALHSRMTTDQQFKDELIQWMVDEQGWMHDPQEWEREILLAAQLTGYVFSTRLLFYEALRRSKPELPALDLPDTATAPIAAATLKAYFHQASVVSGDYETLFTWDRVSEYALVADACVPGWDRVVKHIGLFDVSAIGYDILGKLFERLIDPEERYRWGQHYTLPDVVDLMLSFALPDGDGPVLDPAVGGGTFLVRAYVRKRVLRPQLTHQELLAELYGTDVSGFAASIATVNLAVRQLDFSDNYPRVTVRSFFRLNPKDTLLRIPTGTSVGLGARPTMAVEVPLVKAVVANPPYIRLHVLGTERQQEAQMVLAARGRISMPKKLHGLANYHLYFWLHGAQFLEPGGRLVLITSGEWMDSDYGVALQQWLLANFCIEMFIESMSEAWFSEARVGTVVTVARLCPDEEQRASNDVRFVKLRRRLRELYGPTSSDDAHIAAVDALRDRLCGLTGHGQTADFDWSVVSQRELRSVGEEATVSTGGES